MPGQTEKEYFTTTEAARLLSVSPDTVLKWVRKGKIASYRTPGGHARIPKEAVAGMLPEEKEGANGAESGDAAEEGNGGFKFCWDFYSRDGTVKPECVQCVAFRSRALRCYEMRRIPEEASSLKQVQQGEAVM